MTRVSNICLAELQTKDYHQQFSTCLVQSIRGSDFLEHKNKRIPNDQWTKTCVASCRHICSFSSNGARKGENVLSFCANNTAHSSCHWPLPFAKGRVEDFHSLMELTATVVPLAVASVVTFVLTALPLKLVIIISFRLRSVFTESHPETIPARNAIVICIGHLHQDSLLAGMTITERALIGSTLLKYVIFFLPGPLVFL